MTFNTGNPIGSTDARDRSDNSENMDILENSTTLDAHPDRLGVMRKTRKGMELEHDNQIAAHESEHDTQMLSFENDFDGRLAGMAFTRVGTFTTGATLTDMRQTLLWELSQGGDGHEYGWTGSFLPSGKVVAAGSTPAGTGGVGAGAWVDRTDGALRGELAGDGGAGLIGGMPKPVTWEGFAGGADITGSTPCNAAVTAALQYGGNIHFPSGRYFIPGEGSDAGGIVAVITKSLNVTCDPGVEFFTDSLDNDLIRIEVPSDGAGLPANGITVDWDGGFFDQRNQKNSTVVPFMAEYPPTKPGLSATADALSIRGFYTDDGVVKSGVKRATVRRVVTLGGDHWQSAGGDTGVFIGGVDNQVIEWCYFKGNRDLGAYPSAHESGQLKCAVAIQNNVFDTCFHGAAAKRGFESVRITKNTFINCVRGAQSEFITIRNKDVGIYDNTFIGCGINVRYQESDGGFIHGNTDKEHGATLQNGSIEPVIGLRGYLIESSTGIVIGPNHATAEKAAAVVTYPTQGQGIVITGASSGCQVLGNTFLGWRRLGSDETTGGKNRWKGNVCPNGTAKFVVFTDIANGVEERVADQVGNAPWLRTPLLCSPSSELAPIIKSYDGSGGSAAGLYFKGPDIGLSGHNVLIQGNLYPVTANTTVIGASPSPLAGGFTQAAFTVTSDERLKTTPLDITDAMLDAAAEVDWVQYKYLDRIEAKGTDGARWHFGAVAQRFVEAFEKHGLDAHKFGFICYDEWEAKDEVRDDEGTVIEKAVEAGSRYGIRYEEALALEAALQRRNYQRLLARVESLEAK